MSCMSCSGRGRVFCFACKGTNGSYPPCMYCGGGGEQQCVNCQGSGEDPFARKRSSGPGYTPLPESKTREPTTCEQIIFCFIASLVISAINGVLVLFVVLWSMIGAGYLIQWLAGYVIQWLSSLGRKKDKPKLD